MISDNKKTREGVSRWRVVRVDVKIHYDYFSTIVLGVNDAVMQI